MKANNDTKSHSPLTSTERLALLSASHVTPLTLRKYLRGDRVYGATVTRIEHAARDLRLYTKVQSLRQAALRPADEQVEAVQGAA